MTFNPNRVIPPETHNNSAFQLWDEPLSNRLLNDYVTEGLNIGGCVVNVHKLLGIHEQKKLTLLDGTPICNGEYPEFPASSISENNDEEWHSIKHCGERDPNTYIGIDFGPIKLHDNINKYAIDTEVKYHITSILIQQGKLEQNRVLKARVENSNNGEQWKGISLISLPNDSDEHWIDIKQSFAARYWRLVPISYAGDGLWVLKKLAFSEYTKTHIKNIQDDIFLENRDREYSIDPIPVKAYYDQVEVQTDLSQFGIDLKNQYTFKFGFNLTIQKLRRPIVIGDVLDVLCEIQYDVDLNPIKKYLEVTDVTWTAGAYTPGWQPTIYTVTAQPMYASQETMDIVGDLNSNFFDSVSDKFNTTALKMSDKIRAEANTEVPEKGASHNDTYVIPQDIIDAGLTHGVDYSKLNVSPTMYPFEDGMPPNGEPYTEGDEYPAKPKNKDYHRLTYSKLKEPIAPRLYQYSSAKGRWIYLETDKRFEMNSKKPTLESFIEGNIDLSKIK
jgi:hypothetical protein